MLVLKNNGGNQNEAKMYFYLELKRGFGLSFIRVKMTISFLRGKKSIK
jgi:hypothetical protein